MATFPIAHEVTHALARIDRGDSPESLEAETLEFKSDHGHPKRTLGDLVNAATCLANGQGGTVVVGVENSVGGPGAYSGTSLDPLEVRRCIFDTADPGLTVSVAEHTHRGARLLLIGVPLGAAVHAVAGRVTRRIGRSCLPLAPDQVAALHSERSGQDPSEGRSGRSVDELDPVAVDLARRHLRQLTDDRARWAELSGSALCQAMGVALPDGELLVAGEQLFCAAGGEIVSYQHRRTGGSPPDASARFNPPLLAALDRTLEHIAARNLSDPLLLPGGQQLQLLRYPEDAVREALANAFVHRRLDLTDPIHVEHFDDSLSITSMGPLVSGVTVDNILTTPSRPRNRLLARAFRSLGLIEELGTGVARMYRSMLRLGKEPPTFGASADCVRVSLAGGPADMAFARFVSSLDASSRGDVEVLLVLRHLCATSSATPADIAPILQRSPLETARALERIATSSAPLIESVGASANGALARYRLSRVAAAGLGIAVAHRRHSSSEIEAAVIAHLLEHGRITNRDVRGLFRVGSPRASVVLRELVERQILERISESDRGPAVEYGPGPLAPDRDSVGGN
ncbi:MAG: transcriptional regulator [bacterium]|nr:transcriptional regulator [bacterium]